MKSQQQDFEKQKALLEQKLHLQEYELSELREKEESNKRLYDKMINVIDNNQMSTNIMSSPLVIEYQKKITDLECNVEKMKQEHKAQLKAFKAQFSEEQEMHSRLKSQLENVTRETESQVQGLQVQVEERNIKIKQLEDAIAKKDDFRRVSMDLQAKDYQTKIDKLMKETKDKLEYLQVLKQNEIECQRGLQEAKLQELKASLQEDKEELIKNLETLRSKISDLERQLNEKDQENQGLQLKLQTQLQLSELSQQFESYRLQSQQEIQEVKKEKEEVLKKAEKYEKLYNKLKSESKTQMTLLDEKMKVLEKKAGAKEVDQDELKKLRKLLQNHREKEIKQDQKIRDLQKGMSDTDEILRKELEILKTQNKKLKHEVDLLRNQQSKYKDECERLRLQKEKENTESKSTIAKLKQKVASLQQIGEAKTLQTTQMLTEYEDLLDYIESDPKFANKRESLGPTSTMFLNTTKSLARQKSAGKLMSTKNLTQKELVRQSLTRQNSYFLGQTQQQTHNYIKRAASPSGSGCTSGIFPIPENHNRTSLYFPTQQSPLENTQHQATYVKEHPKSTKAGLQSMMFDSTGNHLIYHNQDLMNNTKPLIQHPKQIKKEIQRLVTLFLQQEGKLKENQEFKDGHFIIKVNQRKKTKMVKGQQHGSTGGMITSGSQQIEKSMPTSSDTQVTLHNSDFNDGGIGNDTTMMIDMADEFKYQMLQQTRLPFKHMVVNENRSKQNYSPRMMVSQYPTLSPRGIFDKFQKQFQHMN